METKFFSVIIPVYNCERYVKECIESVCTQSYSNWELLLIDDGSTDKSGDICDEYTCDTRIQVIHTENCGAAAARILGIKLAKGQYVICGDADDYFDRDCLKVVKEAIDKTGSELIIFGWTELNTGKRFSLQLPENKLYNRKTILESVIRYTNHPLWNKAVLAERLRNADIGFKKRLSINVDYIQIIPILCQIKNGYTIGNSLYYYRIYDNSMSHRCKLEHIIDTDYISQYILNYLEKRQFVDGDMREAVFISYFHMINERLWKLLRNGKISKKECRKISRLPFFMRAKEYENLRNLRLDQYVLHKCIRHNWYFMIILIIKLKVRKMLYFIDTILFRKKNKGV